jgi:hypothetical protein
MSEEEIKIIKQVKTMLENATPFDMPPSRYNALETMVNLIEKQQKEIEIQDKMINNMAQTLLNYGFVLIKSKNGLKEYFRKKVTNE